MIPIAAMNVHAVRSLLTFNSDDFVRFEIEVFIRRRRLPDCPSFNPESLGLPSGFERRLSA